jgi:hypothetical protein
VISAATVGSFGFAATVAARSGSACGRAHKVCRPAPVASRVRSGATIGTSGSVAVEPPGLPGVAVPVVAAESTPSTPGSTAQVTGTGPAGPSTSVPSRMRPIRAAGSSSSFQAAVRAAGSVSNSAADGDRVTGATTASRIGSYCLVRCQPTNVRVVSLVDEAASRTWMAMGMIPKARLKRRRPDGMVMMNGAELPTSTARPSRTLPTSAPPGAAVLVAQASTEPRVTTGVEPWTTRTVGSASRVVRATSDPVMVTVTPGPATGGVTALSARTAVSAAAAGTATAPPVSRAGPPVEPGADADAYPVAPDAYPLAGTDAYAVGAVGPSRARRRSSARTHPRRKVTRCLPAAPRRPVRCAVRWGR